MPLPAQPHSRFGAITALVSLLLVASPLMGVLTLIAGVLLGGRSFESDGPRSPAQYVALLILVVWGAVSYFAARYAGMQRAGASAAAILAVGWSLGSFVLLAAVA